MKNNSYLCIKNMGKEEYIQYLKSFDNDVINKAISNYRYNIIKFNKLETIALNEYCLSMYNYFKTIKIGNILNS